MPPPSEHPADDRADHSAEGPPGAPSGSPVDETGLDIPPFPLSLPGFAPEREETPGRPPAPLAGQAVPPPAEPPAPPADDPQADPRAVGFGPPEPARWPASDAGQGLMDIPAPQYGQQYGSQYEPPQYDLPPSGPHYESQYGARPHYGSPAPVAPDAEPDDAFGVHYEPPSGTTPPPPVSPAPPPSARPPKLTPPTDILVAGARSPEPPPEPSPQPSLEPPPEPSPRLQPTPPFAAPSGSPRRRRTVPTPLLPFVVAIALLVGFGFWRLPAEGGGCDGKLSLSVAADPVVAPAITAIATGFNGESHEISGRCVEVSASSLPSPAIAMALGGDRTATLTSADMYIPDSSLWLAVAGHEATRTGTAPPRPLGSVAFSPLVFTLPKAAGPAFSTHGATMRSLLPAPTGGSAYGLRIIDPERDATGMATLLLARRAAGDGEAALAGFTGILQSVQSGGDQSVTGDAEAALATFGRGSAVPVLVASEQAVWRHARSGGAPIAAVPPADGATGLDFPLVPAGGGAAKARAAGLFLSALRAPKAAAELARAGLRTADGSADQSLTGATGLTAKVPATGISDARAALEVLEMWRRMRLGTRILTLVDVSGSMLEQVPGTGRTRMSVTAGEVEQGMSLLPDAAEAGLWSFSTNLNGSLPYRKLVPLAPLSEVGGGVTQRAELQQALSRLRAEPLGDTGLYDSVLAAYREVKAGYQADKVNIILVLTDGRNDNKDGISRETLLAELKKEYDPKRPVQVIGLAFGPNVDLPDLQRIAGATGGTAFQIRRQEEIRRLFQSSAALKVCDDPAKCPTG